MSVSIDTPGGIILTDPTLDAERYMRFGDPALILVSHEHGEHLDTETLADLVKPDTRLIVPPYVMERLPADLRRNAVALANGARVDVGAMTVEAIPSYGLSPQAATWHPPGRGNSYLVSVEGQRLFIDGSTEAVPEMRALSGIDLAILPLYPPYALGSTDAVSAVSQMQPEVVYIYQYDSKNTRDDFVERVGRVGLDLLVIAPDIP